MEVDDSEPARELRRGPSRYGSMEVSDEEGPRREHEDIMEIADSEPARQLLRNSLRRAYVEDGDVSEEYESEEDGGPRASAWDQSKPTDIQDSQQYHESVLQGFGHRQRVENPGPSPGVQRFSSGFGFLADQAGSMTQEEFTGGERILNVAIPRMNVEKGYRAPERGRLNVNHNSATCEQLKHG
jgi:hypothetical protein